MSDHLQAPVAGQSALGWLLNHLMPWLNYSRLVAGRGVKLERGAGGTLISATPTDALPFVVTITDGLVVVRAGRHYWYDTTAEDYTVTTLDSTAGAWASVAVPTAGNSKYVYFTRAHDSGAVTTATVTKGIATAEATVTALANDYTKVWIVAVLTADADGVVTIDQRLTEDQEDGPDCRTKGTIALWASTTLPRGWAWHTGLQERFPVGYKSGSADYGTIGATGGNAAHGAGVNDHMPHLLNHTHPLCITEDTAEIVTGSNCVLVENDLVKATVCLVTAVDINTACEDIFASWCATHGGDTEAPDHIGTRVAGDHTTTDNRPPFYAVGFIVKL